MILHAVIHVLITLQNRIISVTRSFDFKVFLRAKPSLHTRKLQEILFKKSNASGPAHFAESPHPSTQRTLPPLPTLTIPHPPNKEPSLGPEMLQWLRTRFLITAGQPLFPSSSSLATLLSANPVGEHYTAECLMSRRCPFSGNVLIRSGSIFDHLRWESSLHGEDNDGNFPGRKQRAAQLKAAGCNYLYMCDMGSSWMLS